MSGCKRFFSLGVGAGLPACLSVSDWMFEFQVCGVCCSSFSSETIDFKHLIVKEKSLYENPSSPFHAPKKHPTVSFVSLRKSLGRWRRPWRRAAQLGLQ